MFSTFLHKALMITNMLMIMMLTSVSTSKFVQMVKKKENFKDYENYFGYMATKLQNHERKMTIEEYYNTLHNWRNIQTPAAYGKYNYENYTKNINFYCENHYVNFGRYKRDHDILVFTNAISQFNTCLNAFLTTDEQRKNMIGALEWTPLQNVKSYDPILLKRTAEVKECLRNNIMTHPVYCIYFLFDENKKSQKYANNVLKNIQTKGLSKNGELESCIGLFRESLSNKFQTNTQPTTCLSVKGLFGKKSITLSELYLVLSLIYKYNPTLDDINMSNLFHYYYSFSYMKRTQNYIMSCKSMKKKTEISYTATKLSFLILPQLSEYNSLESYKTRRILIIDYLLNSDKTNSEYYNEIKKYTGNITDKYLKSMVKRRAMKDENYDSYVMRMNNRGYLPLPENLWFKEEATSHNENVQKITTEELTEDLRGHNGT